MSASVPSGYVVADNGNVYVQVPDDSQWGFSVASDDQSWPGGIGLGVSNWELVADDDPRVTDEDRERLQWILDEVRS